MGTNDILVYGKYWKEKQKGKKVNKLRPNRDNNTLDQLFDWKMCR